MKDSSIYILVTSVVTTLDKQFMLALHLVINVSMVKAD